ncbi:MAG: methionine--tRNA ligase [Desulfobacteraceae bacterium]|nr:methionine--tRNA ligase [Desulfobacteraceae bacterium]
MATPFYITTPIYYVNARPHLGHAYTTISADVIRRYHEMVTDETYFLTGTDEHGDKVMRAAKNENLTPREYVDKISSLFKNLWPELHISNDQFIRTTDKNHILVVKKILQQIYDTGDIYYSEYEGQYCFGCERFYTDRELVNGKCPDHETKPEIIKEANYFFRMGKYQEWLIDHIQKHPDFIRPERYKNEVLSFLKEPLDDLCISRPKSRITWGITLPFDENYVTYVWFDALLNYISGLGYPDGELYTKYWPVSQHIIAKDILKPHGIYWPTMLKAAGIPIFKHLNVHGYWNVDQSKMSKSLGNVIDPLELKNVYGLDAFRYFLLREMAFGLDSSFNEEALVSRLNSDLANDLGNLFSRVLAMAHKYFGGEVPDFDTDTEKDFDLGLEAHAGKAIAAYQEHMPQFAFHKALVAVWEFIGELNKYIDVTTPWVLAKNKTQRKQLETVIYNLLEGLRVISGLIYPVMPQTAEAMQKHLGIPPDKTFFKIQGLKKWKTLKPKTQLPKSISLFPRVEATTGTPASGPTRNEKAPPSGKPEITIDHFTDLDLRVGTITHCEPVPRAKKLLKLEVDIGEKRTIVSGIAESYTPDDLLGKQVIIIANLKPAKLMGVKSEGMILAAVDGEKVVVATLDHTVAPGTKVS